MWLSSSNSRRLSREKRFRVDRREQRRLVKRHRADTPRVRQSGEQRHGRAMGVADESERRAGFGEDRLDEIHLVMETQGPVRWPGRAGDSCAWGR
jgi:hypothetical protein